MPPNPRALKHDEVQSLLQQTNGAPRWLYVDVRTPEEFSTGHIEGAFNVPLKHGSLEGLKDNPDFAPIMTQSFSKTAPLILGCHSGGRARAASAQLASLGYTAIAFHADSLAGNRDHFGRLSRGWLAEGLPVTTVVEPGRSYAELLAGHTGDTHE